MRELTYLCTGTDQLVFGRQIFAGKRSDETGEQYEARTWLDRCTVGPDGHVSIPAFAFRRSLVFAGKWLNEKIKGENKKTYTKRIECGITSMAAFFPVLVKGKPIAHSEVLEKLQDVNGPASVNGCPIQRLTLCVSSKGQRGGQTRVIRHFPRVAPGWQVQVKFLVIDDVITPDVFERHATTAGLYDGMGSMRVGTGGDNGRYAVSDIRWQAT